MKIIAIIDDDLYIGNMLEEVLEYKVYSENSADVFAKIHIDRLSIYIIF